MEINMKLKDILKQYMVDEGIEKAEGFCVTINDGETLEIMNDSHPALEQEVGNKDVVNIRRTLSAVAGLSDSFVDQRLSNSIRNNLQISLTRITFDPRVMGGKPCIRGLRVTVGMIVGLVASGHSTSAILQAYPYLEKEDIQQALAYAAWRVEEVEAPLTLVA